MCPKPLPDPDSDVRQTITTGEIIEKLQATAMKVGTKKENRLLMMNAAYTIRQLCQRLEKYETPDMEVH